MRRSKTDFDRAVTMQAEGMTKAAIARTLGVSPSTISRWLMRAGKHAAAFQQVHSEIEDPVEYQLDELSCNGVGAARNAWAYSGIEVWSRMWVSLLVGNRTLRSTYLFVRQVAQGLQERRFPLVVTTDKFKYYEPVMRRVLGSTRVAYLSGREPLFTSEDRPHRTNQFLTSAQAPNESARDSQVDRHDLHHHRLPRNPS